MFLKNFFFIFSAKKKGQKDFAKKVEDHFF